MLQDVGRNARPGVRDRNAQIGRRASHRDAERAALRHRLDRVHEEGDQRPVHLVGVADERVVPLERGRLEPDLRDLEVMAHQHQRAPDDGESVRAHRRAALPGEREEAPHEMPQRSGLALDDLEISIGLAADRFADGALAEGPRRELRVVQDAAQGLFSSWATVAASRPSEAVLSMCATSRCARELRGALLERLEPPRPVGQLVARAGLAVISLNAPASSAISVRPSTGISAFRSPEATRRAPRISRCTGRRTTRRMKTAETSPAKSATRRAPDHFVLAPGDLRVLLGERHAHVEDAQDALLRGRDDSRTARTRAGSRSR